MRPLHIGYKNSQGHYITLTVVYNENELVKSYPIINATEVVVSWEERRFSDYHGPERRKHETVPDRKIET